MICESSEQGKPAMDSNKQEDHMKVEMNFDVVIQQMRKRQSYKVNAFLSLTGESENVPVSTLPAQIYQVLASELKTGFTEAMQELSRIQHGEYALEEKVKSCRCTMEEKVTELKNSLNNLKEEVNAAMAMIHAIIAKQEEMQQKIEQLQQEKKRESRKMKNKRIQKEEHTGQTQSVQNSTFQNSNHSESLMVNYHNNLVQPSPYEKAPASRSLSAGNESNVAISNTARIPHEETDESFKSSVTIEGQSRMYMPSLIWRQPKDGREWEEEGSKEQTHRPRDLVQSRSAPVENVLSEPTGSRDSRSRLQPPVTHCSANADPSLPHHRQTQYIWIIRRTPHFPPHLEEKTPWN
ncbi:unnamed protein product [Ranitomeya imitator]|uniref:Uncharacterized protein n=1 Tax=Ranitomeya imitator TaxID=111125 RepID=A0ABN9LNK1_9NEOB|nr:unnamed protein product [Ranitomeya imitator]